MTALEKRDGRHRQPAAALESLPKGIISPAAAKKRFRLTQFPPSVALAPFVDYHWMVEWDLTGQPAQLQRVLPYPNTHLVFDAGKTGLFGVVRGVFDREITGCGRTLGVRFRSGGLRPFLQSPVAEITDRMVSTQAIIDMAPADAEAFVLSASSDEEMIHAAESMLLQRLPEPDAMVGLIDKMVAAAARRNGPASVEQLGEEFNYGVRRLQRLFHDYVGVSPKWVIQRFRIQEASWTLSEGYGGSLAELAAELGYFDQAHLARDFTRFIGCSPSEYRLRQPRASNAA